MGKTDWGENWLQFWWVGPCSVVQFGCSVKSNSLWPHELQHARPPCPSPTPRVHPNPHPSSWWCHPTISSSVILISSCPQSLPSSESFQMSQFFSSDGQIIRATASALALPMNIQGWFLLRFTCLISFLSKWLLRVFCSNSIQKHHFFGFQPSLWSYPHMIRTWPLEKL